jgi:hypothetical protein
VELLTGQCPNLVPNQAKDLLRSLHFIHLTKYSLVLIDGLLFNRLARFGWCLSIVCIEPHFVFIHHCVIVATNKTGAIDVIIALPPSLFLLPKTLVEETTIHFVLAQDLGIRIRGIKTSAVLKVFVTF